MFSALYFPAAAVSSTQFPEGSPELVDSLVSAVSEGNVAIAIGVAGRMAAGGGTAARQALQLQADLQLVCGLEDEAEENYRRAQRLIRSARQGIRATSCRNAAWQALFRHRLGTALSCFCRVVDEPDAAPLQVREARFGMICTLYELGRANDAASALGRLLADLEQEQDNDHNVQRWRELLLALRTDMAVLSELRGASLLRDHVYWQSGLTAQREPAGCVPVDVLLADASALRMPVLRLRMAYLARLRSVMVDPHASIECLHAHLQWAREQNLGDYQRGVRLEIALATIIGAAPQLADTILEPLHQGNQWLTVGHRQLEYLYCAAKTRQVQGRTQESLHLYCRYAMVAMQCLREDAQVHSPALPRASAATPADDISVRLPGKYRRAYRYLMDNLDRSDLSVREVASEIGVTERALQSAFKNHLGLSPTELIRRQRMERIRAELASGAFSSDRGVLRAASKWGISNRSTLVNGYRREFQEVPSETIERAVPIVVQPGT